MKTARANTYENSTQKPRKKDTRKAGARNDIQKNAREPAQRRPRGQAAGVGRCLSAPTIGGKIGKDGEWHVFPCKSAGAARDDDLRKDRQNCATFLYSGRLRSLPCLRG